MRFQRYTNRIMVSIAFCVCFLATGCDKEEDVVPVINNTVAGAILKGVGYNTLEALLGKANLAIILDGTGPFTVFAPDDSAFAASGITLSYINSLSQQEAQAIMLYHTLDSKVLVADLPGGPNAKVTTFSGDSIFVTKNAGGVYINGAKLLQNDMLVDNGIIHKIDRALNLPVGPITQTIYANGLDSLYKAIARATNDTTGDAGLTNTLNTSIITMFAPTDSAFISLLTALSLTDINEIPVDTLVDIISYHMVPGLIFSSDLVEGSLTMLAGGTTTIHLTNGIKNGPTITGTGNSGNVSNVIRLNIVSRNAILHHVDRVLLP
jgi:uncharacterized surface protein with fasciclin (FAS1) repeats